jgi:hypothetical protein
VTLFTSFAFCTARKSGPKPANPRASEVPISSTDRPQTAVPVPICEMAVSGPQAGTRQVWRRSVKVDSCRADASHELQRSQKHERNPGKLCISSEHCLARLRRRLLGDSAIDRMFAIIGAVDLVRAGHARPWTCHYMSGGKGGTEVPTSPMTSIQIATRR